MNMQQCRSLGAENRISDRGFEPVAGGRTMTQMSDAAGLAGPLSLSPSGRIRAPRLRRATWRPARRRLFDLELDAEVARLRRGLEEARARRYRHDLINAFAAVDCAAILLTKDTLSPPDRATLVDLLGSGLEGLRRLLVPAPEEERVSLADLMTSQAHEPGWPDAAQVEVAPGLAVAGSSDEFVAVVGQVLAHAARRTPGHAVTVRGERRGDRIELWVEDRGRPLTPRERRDLLQPQRRRSLGPIPEGGLDVARCLFRDQGGELKVHARPDGGESFGLSWPAPLD